MYQVLMLLHVFITLALIVIILIQRSDTDGLGGLGGGGNSMSGFMTGKAAANALTRFTAILATLFIVNSLALGIIVAHNRSQGSIAEQLAKEQAAPAVDAGKPAAPAGNTPVVPKPDAGKPDAKAPENFKPEKTPSVPKPE
jgi:preprotein translocase subunit SecG